MILIIGLHHTGQQDEADRYLVLVVAVIRKFVGLAERSYSVFGSELKL